MKKRDFDEAVIKIAAAGGLRPYDRFLCYGFSTRQRRDETIEDVEDYLDTTLHRAHFYYPTPMPEDMADRTSRLTPFKMVRVPGLILVTRGALMRDLIVKRLGRPRYQAYASYVQYEH